MLHVICGAPCAGKTTYVEQNAKENDLIIDADKIAKAFGGSDHQAHGEPLIVALKARETAINHALNSKGETWLIDSLPSAERLRLYERANADIVYLNTSKQTCIERAKNRPVGTIEAIEKYFSNKALQKKHSLEEKRMPNDIEKTVNQEVKTFTQEEVDAIVGDRLKRDRAKYADYEALKEKAEKYDAQVESEKTELERANERANSLQAELDNLKNAETLRQMREQISKETGVPATLLTGETEEDCKNQAAAILDYAKPQSYPNIRDGGELPTTPGKKSTRDQFAEWTEQFFK